MARQEAKLQLGRIAHGDNPAEEKVIDRQATTVKELCKMYLADLDAGLVLGKGGHPKAQGTIVTDIGRINQHIIPLLGSRRLKDLVKADVNRMMKDIMVGRTRMSAKTKKLRGKSIVKGGAGTAARTVSLFGSILTYAGEHGLIDSNPAHGIRKPKYAARQRWLSENEYRTLGDMLRTAEQSYPITVTIIRLIAMTGCRRSEITIAALIGHSKGTMTSKYVHTLDTTLVMAADMQRLYEIGFAQGRRVQSWSTGLPPLR